MEIRVLKYFLMVAREENITRAANLLHISQPTLSRQMMQLEDELGVSLFHRGKHNIILTEDGLFLKRRAQEIVSLADRTQEDFLYRNEGLTGEITIGSGEFQSSRILSDMIASFRKMNPGVRFSIYSGNADAVKEQIESGVLDMGLLMEPVDISRYEFLHMPGKEEWGVLIREDSELARKEYIMPEDLSGFLQISSKRDLVQKELTLWLGEYADQVESVASGNLQYNIASMVKSGIGIAVTIRLDCSYPGICFRPLRPRVESRTVLAWKKTQAFAPATSVFLSYARKYVSGIRGDLI